jgi:hypothetical protein
MAFKMRYNKGDFPFQQAVAESTGVAKPPKIKIKEEKPVVVGDTTFPAGYLSNVPKSKKSGGSGFIVDTKDSNLGKMKKYHGRGRKFLGIHG